MTIKLHKYERMMDELRTNEMFYNDELKNEWDNYYDEDSNINELALSLFVQEADSKLYRKYEELHYQRGYTLNEIISLIEKSGLALVNAYDAFTKKAWK